MKIVAIAFASAALVALAQPGFAQQRMDQDRADRMDRSMHNQFQNDDEQSSTSGQGNNWSERDDWRDRNARGDRDSERMPRGSMRGDMQGRMDGRMGQMMRMHDANDGAAHFRIRRGQAAIDVQCPKAESLQACVNAAGQLLDKIATLRDRNSQGVTSGTGLGSESSDTLSSQPNGSLSNQPVNPTGRSRGDSEQ
jgi:hypothetical protein